MAARLLLALGVLLAAVETRAAELIMFERADCPWCRAWHREIGPIYARAPEAARLPIRAVDVTKPRPVELAAIAGIRFTPTFVAIEHGREIDRLIGYPGEEHFWGWIDSVIARLDPTQGIAPPPASGSGCAANQQEAQC